MSRENSLLTGSEVAQESVGPSSMTSRASGRSEARKNPEDRGCLHGDYGTISERKMDALEGVL